LFHSTADLLAAGQAVVRVPPQLMAGARHGGREPGKSDPIDALAVARGALREPNLPVAQLDDAARQIRLLVDHREDHRMNSAAKPVALASVRALPRPRDPAQEPT